MTIVDSAFAPRAVSAESLHLDASIRDVWRDFAEGRIGEAEAECRAAMFEAQRSLIARPMNTPRPVATASTIKRFRPRRYQCSPDREASRNRRRMLARDGRMPHAIRARYTEGEASALAVIAGEVKHHGVCDLPIDKIAALAGVGRTTVQNAMREAVRLGHIQVERRPLKGRKNDTNMVRIVSGEWLDWIKRGPIGRVPPGLASTQRQVVCWRLAGLASTSLAVLLGVTLAASAVVARTTNAHRGERPAIFPTLETPAASDAQIAYVLARFVRNVRSLPADPVVVRANWIDALDHVTSRGARTLDAYARDENPFPKIGRRAVAVAVEGVDVVRTSADAFNIRWQEWTSEAGAIVKRERFLGVAIIVFKSPNAAGQASKNPLGIYVDRLRWRRELIAGASQ